MRALVCRESTVLGRTTSVRLTLDCRPMMQRDPWAAASHARVSDRWATASAGWNRALTDALIAAAAIDQESLVLDLATGSGDPALDIVQRVASARVIALDRSSAGLLLAKQQSEQLGVASRIVFVQGNVVPFRWLRIVLTASLAVSE